MKTVATTLLVLFVLVYSSCAVTNSSRSKPFQYESLKAAVGAATDNSIDSIDVFDVFTPETNLLLYKMDSLWKTEFEELKKTKPADKNDKKRIKTDVAILTKNRNNLTTYLKNKNGKSKSNCIEKECTLVAEVVKSKQLMYLYLDGALKDSFAVSTGIPGRETPDMNVRPTGPLFIKYTSRKYPEGDYHGLGNMPYAVFVKGGYAIHGTTPGNFTKLGRKASHGCIRLHPDNAKLFYELVNMIGLGSTWIIVRS